MECQNEDNYKRKFLVDLDRIYFSNINYNPNDAATHEITTNYISGNTVLEVRCGPNSMNSLIVSPYFQQFYPSNKAKKTR